jgi:mono/diheme cytochrome c family protein
MRKSGAWLTYAVTLAGACVPTAWLALSPGVAQAQEPAPAGASQPYRDLLNSNCSKCHNATDWAGGLAFDTLDLAQTSEDPEIWEKAINKLSGRLMPPAGEKQPAQADVDAFVDYLKTSLDASDAAAKDRRVGHVPLQRLNRTEYAASVKGLLGVDVDPKQILPTEIEVDGFSNVAGALSISPTFMEQYLSAARHVAQTAVGEPNPKMSHLFFGGGGGGGGQAGLGSPMQYVHKDGYPLGTRGGVSFTYTFPADGEYRFNFKDGDSLDAGLYPRGMETTATLVVLVDGTEVARRQIGGSDDLTLADRDGPKGRSAITTKVSGIPAEIKAGTHTLTFTFIERSWAESNDPTGAGRTFGIGMPIIRDGIEVVGPYSPQGLSLSASRAKIFVCEPKQPAEERPCAERIARHLAAQAFRRPVTDDDVAWLMKFYEHGRAQAGGFDSGVTELITAILSSPDFLYRSISSPTVAGQSRPLTDLELASRLSFFLWNQGPDGELLTLAGKKQLSDPKVLDGQVARMLKDPRAQSLVTDFAFSWLNFGTLSQIEPLDREFNGDMRRNFETEARLFLSSVLLENRNVTDLLTADWTFVNDTLARQYGMTGVLGPQFRRVTLKDENRWGLLGKGAFQLRTSYSDRTSPVLRGAYVLDRLLGTPPHPPPPNVVTDLSFHEGQPPTTVRQRLEAHRTNPTCRSCHGLIDPLGLVLENFDVTGRWRTADPVTKVAIDPTAELSSGLVLRNPADLRRYLTRRPEQFPTTVTKRLMMYALNRELEYYDMPQVRKVVRDAAASNYTAAALITGIVESDAFRRQGADVKPKNTPDAHLKVASDDTRSKDAQPLRREN